MKKYILVISIITLVFIWNTTFSRTSNCEFIKEFDWEIISDSKKNDFKKALGSWLLTEQGMLKSLTNLKKYCCFNTEELKWDKNCEKLRKKDKDNDYPKSPFLIDHILSVMVRRLDYKNYTWVEMDKKAAEWLKFIDEYATKPEWAIPVELTSKYREYRLNDKSWDTKTVWKMKINIPKYKISLYDATSQGWYLDYLSGHDKNKFKKMEDWDLSTKYMNICQISILITQTLWAYDNNQDMVLDQEKCLKKINEQTRKTALLYWYVEQTQSDQLIKKTHKDYADYWKWRGDTVSATLWKTNTYLFWVIRMIQQITPKCN